jgi:folate-binding protein YgfZ
VGSPGCAERVAAHLDRYTFAERFDLRDVTSQTYQLAVIGRGAARALEELGHERPQENGALEVGIAGHAAHLLGQDGYDAKGFAWTGPVEQAAEVWSTLAAAVRRAGGRPAGADAFECYRVLEGLPAGGHELTEEWNPLEAGLDAAVSFDKGCYVGQEVVARLHTYDKVSRSLVGLELPAEEPLPERGTPLLLDGSPVGVLTSVVRPASSLKAAGLGYVKRKALAGASTVQAGPDGPAVRIRSQPFLD